jgi:nitrogen fixation protein NifB
MRHHPCFDKQAHEQVGRVHLPVAPRCNIQCAFCERKICMNLTMQHPGWARKLVSPLEAVELVHQLVCSRSAGGNNNDHLFVVGVAGPGEPLENDETFEALSLINHHYPDLIKCVSTNGLLLEEKLSQIIDAGITALTVTVNAPDCEVGKQIYKWVRHNGKFYWGQDAAKILISNQMRGIQAALEAGIAIKVNTVLIPGVNDECMVRLAYCLNELGVRLMNIIPLIPSGRMKHHRAPTCSELRKMRLECAEVLPQFWWCKQCSADVVHFPSEDHFKNHACN